MANLRSEKCSFSELLNILPKIRTLSDLCYLNEISCNGFSRKWMKLLFFVAYNASSLNNTLNKAIQELQLFVFMITSENQLPTLLKSFESERSAEIIINHFNFFTQQITQSSFYNKKENTSSIISILQLIPRIKEMSHQMQCDIRKVIHALKTFYAVLKENVVKYEQDQQSVYSFHLNILSLIFEDNLKNIELDIKEKNNLFDELQYNDTNEISEENMMLKRNDQSLLSSLNQSIKQEPKQQQKMKKELKTNNTSINNTIKSDQERNKRKRNAPQPKINDLQIPDNLNLISFEKICQEMYCLHLKSAKFYPNDYYKDESFIMTRIGSTTFGLNNANYSCDFLIQPRNGSVKQIVFQEVITWLHQKKIDNQVYFFDSTFIPKYQKGIAYFTCQDIQGTYPVKLYLYNGGYELVNTFFQNFFAKNSVFAKLYVFCIDLLKLDSGIHLSLLIHGFFVTYFKLYCNKGRYFDFQVYTQGFNNIFSTKKRTLFYYELFSSAYKEMSEWNMSKVIISFLNFFVTFFHKKDLVLSLTKNDYLFRLDSTMKRLENSKDQNYWKNLIKFNEMLLKDKFSSYTEMQQFINE